jgi:hypothetical protein
VAFFYRKRPLCKLFTWAHEFWLYSSRYFCGGTGERAGALLAQLQGLEQSYTFFSLTGIFPEPSIVIIVTDEAAFDGYRKY